MNGFAKFCMKLVMLSSLLFLLGACNKNEETLEPEEKLESEKKPEVIQPPDEEVIIAALTDEDFFQEVYTKLQNNGFTVSEPLLANIVMFKAETGMTLVVNGESLLPLHLYKIASTDERLPKIDQTGTIEVAIGSKREPLAVNRVENFVIYLHKGHPDYENIMQVIE